MIATVLELAKKDIETVVTVFRMFNVFSRDIEKYLVQFKIIEVKAAMYDMKNIFIELTTDEH